MLQTTQLIGFGAGSAGGLGAETFVKISDWEGTPAKWNFSDTGDGDKDTAASEGIRLKNSGDTLTFPGDFVIFFTALEDPVYNTAQAIGLYDIAEDSTFSTTDNSWGAGSMTASYYIFSTGSLTHRTMEGSTQKTTGLTFSVNDTFKFSRTGSTLSYLINDVQKDTWTTTKELRFAYNGTESTGHDFADMKYRK